MFDYIPPEIKAIPRWVCAWDGSKVPMQARQRKAASSSNPDTWSDYETAERAVESGMYDYVGFVFHDDGIIGIDIDCGFDEHGLLSSTGREIIALCHSYTEKSRSGRGVHILLRGTLPFAGKNNGEGVEIYRTGRYFILTGQKLLFADMIENQEAIDAVVERFFPNVQKEGSDNPLRAKIYTPEWENPKPQKVPLRPRYPKIKPGMRNDSLASVAGQLWGQGYEKAEVYRELCRVNTEACDPPLPLREVQMIIESITRYRRNR